MSNSLQYIIDVVPNHEMILAFDITKMWTIKRFHCLQMLQCHQQLDPQLQWLLQQIQWLWCQWLLQYLSVTNVFSNVCSDSYPNSRSNTCPNCWSDRLSNSKSCRFPNSTPTGVPLASPSATPTAHQSKFNSYSHCNSNCFTYFSSKLSPQQLSLLQVWWVHPLCFQLVQPQKTQPQFWQFHQWQCQLHLQWHQHWWCNGLHITWHVWLQDLFQSSLFSLNCTADALLPFILLTSRNPNIQNGQNFGIIYKRGRGFMEIGYSGVWKIFLQFLHNIV